MLARLLLARSTWRQMQRDGHGSAAFTPASAAGLVAPGLTTPLEAQASASLGVSAGAVQLPEIHVASAPTLPLGLAALCQSHSELASKRPELPESTGKRI